MAKIIRGTLSVGEGNPVYNRPVEIRVITENTGHAGKSTWCETVRKYKSYHCTIDIRSNAVLKEWYVMERISGWLN